VGGGDIPLPRQPPGREERTVERLKGWLIRLVASERGQDMVEYAMITMFISVAVVLAVVAVNLPGAFGLWAVEVCNEVAPGTC
jgi:Flp pilus assembly pilin Flp